MGTRKIMKEETRISSSRKNPATVTNYGAPLALDIRLIDEDPGQPRTSDNPGFARASLDELATSINLRGVKTPISVREHPASPGRFLINHGARRFRASIRAGKTTIPAFIDNDYNEADQVVENLQRNELTAREIADYIGREVAKGLTKREIARSISKSPAFVTQHSNLLDLPDPIAEAFSSGRARDVTLINELLLMFKTMPQEVSDWLADSQQEVTRSAVKLLRSFLENKHGRQQYTEFPEASSEVIVVDAEHTETAVELDDVQTGHMALKKVIVEVRHHRRHGCLLLTRRPTADGMAWLRYEDDGAEAEVSLSEIRMTALREG